LTWHSILGLLALAKKHRPAVVEDAVTAALETLSPWPVTTIGGGDITTMRISSPLSRMTMRFSIGNGRPSSHSVFVPEQSGLTV
jgi:hypothetical protein